MILENLLRESLVLALNPSLCDLDNESHGHNVPKNAETHFRLVIVSDVFDGLSRVKRHQLVYKAATINWLILDPSSSRLYRAGMISVQDFVPTRPL